MLVAGGRTMNERIRQLKAEIERRGGMSFISDDLPDEVAELFLQEILTCPDCMEEPRQISGPPNQRKPARH